MNRRWWVLVLIGLACLAGQSFLSPPVLGQEADRLATLSLDPETGAATVMMGDLFAEPRLQQALEAGLPLRVRVQVELWRDRFFDRQVGAFEWRMNFVMDPLGGGLQVLGPGPPPQDLLMASLDEARAGRLDRPRPL